MAFKLTIEQGKGRGQTFEFDADEITIGRTDENDVVLYEGGVSRQHAKIAFDGQHFSVSDMESANGTTLNGSKIASEVLEDGDQIGIGAVVFRFEAAAPVGGATRIVSIEQAEKQAAAKAAKGSRPSGVGTAGAAKAAPPSNPRAIRLGGVGIGALLLAALVAVAVKGKTAAGIKPCPAFINVSDVKGYVFGRGVDADCEAPKSGLKLGFEAEAKTRYLLHYAPFFVKQGEVVLLFNGKKIDDAPSAPARRSARQTVTLPDGLVKAGEKNELVFQNTKGADESWGVERLELESIGLAEADPARAQEHYRLGTKLYHDKNVAAPNLFNAWMELRDARRYMEGLDPQPDIYRPTADLLRDIEKELDALCKKQLFAAQQDARYEKFERANEAYKFILAAFPTDAHPCRAQAEAGMYVEQQEAAE